MADYNSAVPAGINSEAAQNFGITNMTGMYDAMMSSASAVQHICMPVVSIAFLIQFFLFMTKLFGERTVDYREIGKVFLLMLFLFNYTEIMMQINSIISYFTSSTQIMFDKYGSGHTIVDKVNDVYDSYKKKHPDPGFFGSLSNFMDWIIANCTHIVIVVARAITYIIRSFSMVFLFTTGPIAILATMFPGFEGTLKHWIGYYVQVGFWMVTLGILDMILYQYLQYCEDTSTIDGITTVNIGMALMYLMGPYLTTKYLGTHGSMFMSRMIQNATSAVTMTQNLSKNSSPTLQYAAEKTIDAGTHTLSKVDNTLAGGGQGDNLARTSGMAYGALRNNTIRTNQSE